MAIPVLTRPTLVILAGLPGVGKTTVSRALARRTGAFYIRIDSIERALAASSLAISPAADAGYCAAYAVAADNLTGGAIVIADSVNPIEVTRAAWRSVAERAGAAALQVEIVCTETGEHRRRVETRPAEFAGHRLPTWADVEARDYAPFERPNLVLDTARLTAEEAAARIADAIS